MLATKITCPYCSKHLKFSKPLAVGHRILCSGCGRSFPVRFDEIRKPTPTPPPTTQPVAPRRPVAVIAVVLGGLLFLMGSTLALTLYFATRPEPQTVRAETAPTVPTESDHHPSDPPAPLSSPPPSEFRAPIAPPPLASAPPPPRPKPAELAAEPQPRSAASPPSEEQERINRAIDRGVQWLMKHQTSQGYRGFVTYPVGLSSLVGLTLLECGVANEDKHIQDALRRVRDNLPQLNATYQLALAILFLDRYGDAKDEKWIRTCALRLAASQARTGGWDYTCRILNEKEELALLAALEKTRPTDALDLFAGGSEDSSSLGFLMIAKNAPDVAAIEKKPQPEAKAAADRQAMESALAELPADLRRLPALQSANHTYRLPDRDVTRTDNSNTQFAILGLCAAQRHRIPLERTLALIAQRFRKSQTPNGGWSYNYLVSGNQHTPSMTGAGLLGLAVGHGLVAEYVQPRSRPARLDDPAIEKGMRVLAESIGEPQSGRGPRRRSVSVNLYFLWTVERVGVLYNRRQIGGKEWYPWGAQVLLDRQNRDGSWMLGGYPGTSLLTDTCFALLFLKRANLAKELTKKLEFFAEERTLRSR